MIASYSFAGEKFSGCIQSCDAENARVATGKHQSRSESAYVRAAAHQISTGNRNENPRHPGLLYWRIDGGQRTEHWRVSIPIMSINHRPMSSKSKPMSFACLKVKYPRRCSSTRNSNLRAAGSNQSECFDQRQPSKPITKAWYFTNVLTGAFSDNYTNQR